MIESWRAARWTHRKAAASRAVRRACTSLGYTREVVVKPFDERLYTLKLQEALVPRMHRDTEERRGKVLAHQRKIGQALAGALHKLADSDIGVVREYVPEADKVCRETYLSDGNTITSEFIRNVLVHRVFSFIAVREGDSRWNLELVARRCRINGTDLTPALHHLVHRMNQLKSEVANRYEIEAMELSKKEARVRKVTQALSPPIEVVGTGSSVIHLKPTQIPPDFPTYFPNDLKSRAHLIIVEAVRKFPEQTQTLKLCKYVISEMTPVFSTAVQAGTIEPEQVFTDAGMGGLLHLVLVYNCDRDSERFRLGQEARKSDEWLMLAREIDELRLRPRVDESKPETWAKLKRRGDFIVLAEQSSNTATQIRNDYGLLKWNIRQLDQWVSQRKQDEEQPRLEEVKAAFSGTILVGDTDRVPYLTDRELGELLAHRQTPSSFAEAILAKRWGFTAATVKTYVRRRVTRKSTRDS
jgi:hypothetical protein